MDAKELTRITESANRDKDKRYFTRDILRQ